MEDQALDQAPVWDDLASFDGRRFAGLVDLISAGYPCQPFSTAGRRRGAADERHLWPHVARIVGECRPALVFGENVDAHLRLGFVEVLADLWEMGYRVEAGTFSAAEVGAPHLRKRLFFLAHRLGDALRTTVAFGKSRTEPGYLATTFPPGPTDLDAWRDVLVRDPSLEPALCGMADGLADRVDRLRATGNGVVPVVAAYAFATLARAHGF